MPRISSNLRPQRPPRRDLVTPWLVLVRSIRAVLQTSIRQRDWAPAASMANAVRPQKDRP